METKFEFADPTVVNEPHKHDAAEKIQARFRGSSARKLIKEEKDKKIAQMSLVKGKGGGHKKKRKKSPEKR